MPVYAPISPTFSVTEQNLDALNAAAFYTETAANGAKMNIKTQAATLAHFEKVFIFMVDPKSSKWASLHSFFIASAAFISCLMLFLQTLDGPNHHSTQPDYPNLPAEDDYAISDLLFTVIFTTELLVRMVIWPSLWKDHDYLTQRRLKPFLRDFFNWFDFASIAPFYTDLIFGKDKSIVILRLCRLLRIFKLARNHSGTYILLRAIKASLAPISIALIFFLEIVLFFSVLMYMADPNVDRTKMGFSDLLSSGYFVVVTVATIGYGDITPTKGNVMARVFAVMIIMSGTLFLSMPLAIIGTEFDRAWKEHAEHVLRYQQQGHSADAAAVAEDDPDHKHEVLVKYNTPNKLYLRLAALTGEASLMVQALVQEANSDTPSVTKLQEVADDMKQQVETCYIKCEELGYLVKDMIAAEVEYVPEKLSFRAWLKRALSDPSSSRTARWIFRWINSCLLLSMIIVVFQTMPDLQTYGEETYLCERAVQYYCETVEGVTPVTDPGCFRVDRPLEPLRFYCTDEEKTTDPACYGYGDNYGNPLDDSRGLSCENATTLASALVTNSDGTQPLDAFNADLNSLTPFRPDTELPVKNRRYSICKRWECDNLHVTFVEFGEVYTALEYLFTFTYVFEFIAAMWTCESYRVFFKNPVIYVEMASFIPFFVYESRRFFSGTTPIYVITPGSRDFLTFLRLLRVLRIFKIQQSIPVTKVLWESISKTSTRLTIPYFMLVLVTTVLSFIMFELEKGEECFYGHECLVGELNVTDPPELAGSVFNKRYLVNSKGQISSFDDFFSAFWFVIVTLSTVGYGDMEPVSTAGKLVAVIAMLVGACYTAMPLTLVGSQFNKSYREHKRREALLLTKIEVSKPYGVSAGEYQLWEVFAENKAFKKMQNQLKDHLWPILEVMASEEVIDDDKRTCVLDSAQALKELIYRQRLLVMQVGSIVNKLRKEGMRLAEQQTTALQSIS
ncbi:hypothetical protein Poli38472_005472 [Pythium oligandrum]|uniref:Ion transport domain-containing protein n=1 Tax=Pythium oligandrum TaxID=41045 RepID=A0A8K1CGY6_PYTOL|nr:hypothetical protein Poli38472_005472 [Pythium oligandrum]|eukprot:TMW62854.1 hypothetical protein Poli38472_005472 [Pythium oligandrum]